MAIKMQTPMAEIDRYIAKELERLQFRCVREMSIVGEKAVNAARSAKGNVKEVKISETKTIRRGRPPGTYADQTGNLRSSVGYVVAIDGSETTTSGFSPVKGGSEGSSAGRAYAAELARENAKGITLAIVAGMNYAKAVQAKGLDVTHSATRVAEEEMPKALKRLKLK